MLTAIFKLLVTLFALVLIVVGLILTPSPLPFGLIIVALGLSLLVAVAPDLVRWLRGRWRWFDRRMHDLEDRLPEFMSRPLRRTDIDHDADDGHTADNDRRGDEA